jgi:hypothetical protein
MWWIALASAAVPEGLLPAAAPWDAPEQYAAYALANGRADTLACESVWPGNARLCFKLQADGRRRWVTSSDLTAWGVTTGELVIALRERAAQLKVDVEKVQIDGMNGHYVQLRDGDGWAALALLTPERLAAELGGAPILVGLASEGVAVAWKPGREDVDKVMLIGVSELFSSQEGAVTPAVYAWSDRGYTSFGRAEPTESP